jgi:two-component system NtrC family response regulator/two-component system response regulator HydG
MERAVVLTEQAELTAAHFPTIRPFTDVADATSGKPGIAIPGSSLAELEREAILRTLEALGGSTSRAAELLQISTRKIQYKLKEYQQEDALATKRP